MEQITVATEETKTAKKMKPKEVTGEKVKRKAATQFHVTYKTTEGDWGVTTFDFKPEMDQWMRETNVTIVKLVRGTEKKFTTKILLA